MLHLQRAIPFKNERRETEVFLSVIINLQNLLLSVLSGQKVHLGDY